MNRSTTTSTIADDGASPARVETPSCCEACGELDAVDGSCALLAERRLAEWIDGRPCRVDEQVRRTARARGGGSEQEDLVQEVFLRILEVAERDSCRVPTLPGEGFRWIRSIAARRAIDLFRRDADHRGGGPPRRLCGNCSHFDETERRCGRQTALDEESAMLRTNPIHLQRVDPRRSPACELAGESFYEPTPRPRRATIETGLIASGADDPADRAHALACWDRLAVEHPRSVVALSLVRDGHDAAAVGRRLGTSTRSAYRLLRDARDRLERWLRSSPDTD